MELNKNQLKLAKQLEIEKNLTWNKYIDRFNESKPLKIWPTMLQTLYDAPEQVECEIELIGNLSSEASLKRFKKLPKIIGGFKQKITKKKIDKLDYLYTNFLGLGYLFRRNIIDIMLSICPDDFEPVPVTLINLNKAVEPFEIKDFYAINVLKCIKALDEKESNIEWSKNGMPYIKKFRYKENPWQEGAKVYSENRRTNYELFQYEKPCMLAIDAISGSIVWHPKLAKAMPPSPMWWFITDKEQKG